MNLIVVSGHLGKDPELRHTQSQKAVTSFSVATTEKRKTENGIQENTTWHDIVCWERVAENVAKFCTKGSKVLVQGKLNKRNYEGKDGQKIYVTEIVAHSVEFLSSPKQQQAADTGSSFPKNSQDDLDSIPF